MDHQSQSGHSSAYKSMGDQDSVDRHCTKYTAQGDEPQVP